ncbi:MAG: hypothetical protein KBA81_00015 [Rhabdochlamydiaceae bacterium]|nr:hypothetical protein [Rhabdochlamydiaceae bacterium]
MTAIIPINKMNFSYAAKAIEEEIVRNVKEKANKLCLDGKVKGMEPFTAIRLAQQAYKEFQNKLSEQFLEEYTPFIGLVKTSEASYFNTKLRFELEALLVGEKPPLSERQITNENTASIC